MVWSRNEDTGVEASVQQHAKRAAAVGERVVGIINATKALPLRETRKVDAHGYNARQRMVVRHVEVQHAAGNEPRMNAIDESHGFFDVL